MAGSKATGGAIPVASILSQHVGIKAPANVEKKSINTSTTQLNGHASPSMPVILDPSIKLLVCDMAGTTVEEAGLVYVTLRECLNAAGLTVSEDDMHPWHGAQKSEVVAHFAGREGLSAASTAELEKRVNAEFEERLEASYMAAGSPLAHIHPSLPEHFNALRARGIKIGLNTGYPRRLQDAILKKLHMLEFVDATVSAAEVRSGRPSPYMVHHLMEITGVEDVRAVAKAGDTERDIGEGLNAGCGMVFGVLSGADSAETLFTAGAHHVVDNVTSIVSSDSALASTDPVILRLEKLLAAKKFLSSEAYAAKEREILAAI
mmetsp:Transcript_83898/g.251439  ORF Transcript_83898/g.251439 Transcript_83898/m.251439 type:complete len:319 (-) Transcript_83898:670-1626(-)